MGVGLEFNWMLALRRDTPENRTKHDLTELLPSQIECGREYRFRKKELRIYPINQPMILTETRGSNQFGDPRAVVVIREYTHKAEQGKLITEGTYLVERLVTKADLGQTIDYGLWTPQR